MITCIENGSTWVSQSINSPISRGGYTAVAIEKPIGDGDPRIIWVDENDGVVSETLGPPKPFRILLFDFDGTLVNSEGKHGIFAVAWRNLHREAGNPGSDDGIYNLHSRIYRWDQTLPMSTQQMIERIRAGIAIDGTQLTADEQEAAQLLLEPDRLRRWAEQNGGEYSGEETPHDANIIADEKERIGADLLKRNPLLVQTLAPIQPGVKEVFGAVHSGVMTGIISASRVNTTILPILEAHAATGNGWLLNRVGPLVVGEDNIMGDAPKPSRKFYDNALITGAHMLHRDGRIPPGGISVEDMVIVGDQIAGNNTPDAPTTRKGASHIVLMADKDVDDVGPKAAVVPDMHALRDLIYAPMNSISNPILKRFKLTFV